MTLILPSNNKNNDSLELIPRPKLLNYNIQNASSLSQYVTQYQDIRFLYTAFRTKIANDIKKYPIEELIYDIEELLSIAELLKNLANTYFQNPTDVNEYIKDQKNYYTLLNKVPSIDRVKLPLAIQQTFNIETQIKNTVTNVTFPRFILLRMRQLLLAMDYYLLQNPYLHSNVALVNNLLHPIARYSWLSFLPRLVLNLTLLTKHVIPGTWMNHEAKQLSYQERFSAQVANKWFELATDIVWFSCGAIIFSITGSFITAVVAIALGLQYYDLLLNTVRFEYESSRLDRLNTDNFSRTTSIIAENNQNPSANFNKDLQQYVLKKIDFAKSQMTLGIINAFYIALGATLCLPLFIPIIQVVGGVILVATTVITYFAAKSIHNPDQDLAKAINDIDDKCANTSQPIEQLGLKNYSVFNNLAEDSDTGNQPEPGYQPNTKSNL